MKLLIPETGLNVEGGVEARREPTLQLGAGNAEAGIRDRHYVQASFLVIVSPPFSASSLARVRGVSIASNPVGTGSLP